MRFLRGHSFAYKISNSPQSVISVLTIEKQSTCLDAVKEAKAIFITSVLKTLTQLKIVLFRVLRFSAESFNAVTSFIRNIFKPGRHLGTEI